MRHQIGALSFGSPSLRSGRHDDPFPRVSEEIHNPEYAVKPRVPLRCTLGYLLSPASRACVRENVSFVWSLISRRG